MNTLKNKIAGSIYGFAIGDAMGATTEFMFEDEIKKKYGKVTDIIGGGWLNLRAGEITDDTQMTMCVMEALMKTTDSMEIDPFGYEFLKECRRLFIQWFNLSPKDVGAQCAKAITYMKRGWMVMCTENSAQGNGSLMRAMPCAILGLPKMNEWQGRMTHNNHVCSEIIQEYTEMIQEYLHGNNTTVKPKELLEPTGHVRNTFNNAVYWSNKGTFEEAIIGAVNHGGDADTIAAITGSLAGAKFGFSNIPQRWIDGLDPWVVKELEKFKKFAFSYLQI